MPEAAATNTDNSLANPPANVDNGIQQVLNASDPDGDSSESQGTGQAEGTQEGTQAGTQGEGQAEGTAAAGDENAKKTPWFQRRIDQVTAEKWEERREKENLRRQVDSLLQQLAETRKTGVTPPAAGAGNAQPVAQPAVDAGGNPIAPVTPPAAPVNNQQPTRPSVTEAEINAMAEKRAGEMARQQAFTKACNDVYSNGKDDFQDFDQSLRTFQMLGGIPQPLLEIVTEMPNAHKVLYKLGKDLDLAEKVVKMSPTRMAMELARLESAVTKPVVPVVSGAPRPVTPVDGGSRSETDPERMSTETWIAWREAELAKKRK